MQEKQRELQQALAKLNKAEKVIETIETHRQEGEGYTLVLVQQQELKNQQHHLRGNIESYTDSRSRSAGGQCPLLHQTCLNIQQQGQLSLEAYFNGLLDEEQAQLTGIERQLRLLGEREMALKKHAEGLEKLGQYIEQRDGNAERIERLNLEIRRLERDAERLRDEWESLQQIDQEIARARALLAESERADRLTRKLPGYKSQEEQFEKLIEQHAIEFEELKKARATDAKRRTAKGAPARTGCAQ